MTFLSAFLGAFLGGFAGAWAWEYYQMWRARKIMKQRMLDMIDRFPIAEEGFDRLARDLFGDSNDDIRKH